MWKGVLLGILLFIVGGISYAGIRVGIVLYRLGQQVKTGTITRGDGGAQWDIRIWLGLLHCTVPYFWVVFLAAIAIGLWIMRARAIHTV